MAAPRDLPAGDVTFLFSDIVGSTRRWERDPAGMAAALDHHHALSHDALAAHGGRVVKDTGDGFMAAFARPADAVRAAIDLQRGLGATAWTGPPLQVRIGLHVGPAAPDGGDYHGATVNRCARVMDVAHGGQVVVTAAVRDAAAADGLSFESLGLHRLKDLEGAVALHQVVATDLPSDFPPLRSLTSTPNNLPHVATPLLGRDAELADLARLLDTHRLVTLTGAGGIGKTRLAYQVAADHLDHVVDGVWVVELGSTTDTDVVEQVTATALRAPDAPGRTAEHRVLSHLADRELLIVVDNCEHLLDPVARLVHAVLRHAPGVRVLATSREPLGIPAERVVPVPPLPTAPEGAAVQLFVDRAVAAGAAAPRESELSQVAELCTRLDGLPLAIELAAARARVLPLSEIAGRLDHRFTLLTGGSRTALPRQRTLEATVAWSYDLLDEDAQLLLRRLSVFASTFSLDDVRSVCTDPPLAPDRTLDLVSELLDRSLLTREVGDEATFRLLETIRAYARERLMDSNDEEVAALRHNRLAWAVAETAEAATRLETADQLRWLRRVDARLDDHRAAMQWAVDQGRWEQGAAVASNLYRRWFLHDVREGREWLARFVAAADHLPEPLLARVLFTYGSLAQTMGDHPEALRALGRAVSLYERLEVPRGLAYAQHYLVRSSWGARPRDEVRDLTDRALALFRDIGDPVGIGLTLLFVAIDEFERGRHHEGLEAMAECDAAMRSVGAPHLIAHAPEITAWGLAAMGEDVAAAEHFSEAVPLYREVGNAVCSAHCLENVALLLTRHDPRVAATLLGAMEAIREDIGVPVPPYENMAYEPAVDTVRRLLDAAELEELWAAGRRLSADEALDLALRAMTPLTDRGGAGPG